MEILNLIVGLFMIGIGFLVKSVPDLIAGYNTMSKEQKENVDIEGLSTFMRNGLIAIGISIIIGYYLFKWIGFTLIANSMLPLVTLVGVTILVIKAQRFDQNKNKKTKLTYFILGLVFILVIGLITYGFIPSKVIFSKESVQFSGMYGIEIKIAEIDNVKLVDNLPEIKMRTNGFSFGTVKKGFFDLNEFGKSRLLIQSEKPPYLIISKGNGEKTIINFKEKSVTESTYSEIKTLIEKNNCGQHAVYSSRR
ncbi:DUF3784 domain-containing protein [Xiashengella succiniciproducens]|uniref:DUF3784 domain-containing protein n=1 Tax=Xiashengella succiniciproducens TaxID=2949635 RepID=A0A9J6ZNJ3_9BACT|nr:DUF3784 domain-containing protein [Alkaliflexus sp. Ai-910]URW79094.1 DUF3784 domain-containing protein [Alkaliflexus sp. Ai-910]